MKVYNNKKMLIIAVILIVIIATFIYGIYSNSNSEAIVFNDLEVSKELENESVQKESLNIDTNILRAAGVLEEDKIAIHIIGQIKKEGIIYMNKKSRLVDAIEEAGGITDKADLSKVNLALELEDAMKIYIPSKDAKDNLQYASGEKGADEFIESTKVSEKKQNKLININIANEQELQTLPGVGISTANKILTYRKENGKFNKIEDLKNVSGIGEAKFNKIKEFITVK